VVSFNDQLVLSPVTAPILTALTNQDFYELICGDESSYKSLLFASSFSFNRNFRKTLKEFQPSKNFIIQISSRNEETDEIKCLKKEAAVFRQFNSLVLNQISNYHNGIQNMNQSLLKINSLIGTSLPLLEKQKIVFQPNVQYDFENMEEQVDNFLSSTILKLDFNNIIERGCDSLNLNSIVSLINHFAKNACVSSLDFRSYSYIAKFALSHHSDFSSAFQALRSLFNIKAKFDVSVFADEIRWYFSVPPDFIKTDLVDKSYLETADCILNALLNSVDFNQSDCRSSLPITLIEEAFQSHFFANAFPIFSSKDEQILGIFESILSSEKKFSSRSISETSKKALQIIPITDSHVDFVFRMSQRNIDTEARRHIVAAIARQVKLQELYGIKPSQVDILFNSLKNIFYQDQNAMTTFIGQLIDSNLARAAIQKSQLFFDINQNPSEYVRMPFGNLQFPRSDSWTTFFEDVASEFMCSALLSPHKHINDLAVRVLGSVTSSNDKITEKIAPFISKCLSEYNNKSTNALLLSFSTSFVMVSRNKKFDQTTDAFIELFRKISIQFNVTASHHIKEMMGGDELGFEWANNESSGYDAIGKSLDKLVNQIFKDKSEVLSIESREDLVRMNEICHRILDMIKKDGATPIVETKSFQNFMNIIQIISDDNFKCIATYENDSSAIESLIKLFASEASEINSTMPNFIPEIFEFFIDELVSDARLEQRDINDHHHMRILAGLTHIIIPFEKIILMLRESILMCLQIVSTEEFNFLIPSLSKFI
jgi:hypothetical protein